MSGIATTQMMILKQLQGGQPITLDWLAERLAKATPPIERRFVVNAAGRLVYSGMIERAEKGVYQITLKGIEQLESGEPIKSGKTGKRTGVRRMRANGLRQRMWKAIRQTAAGGHAKVFSLPDIMTVALNEGEESEHTYNNAGQYIRQLKKTGYLLTINRRQAGTRPGSNGFQLYKLVRDTGEQAPVVRVRLKQIHDRNTGEVFSW